MVFFAVVIALKQKAFCEWKLLYVNESQIGFNVIIQSPVTVVRYNFPFYIFNSL